MRQIKSHSAAVKFSENMEPRKKVPKTFCTTHEASLVLGVSVRTAQLWTESGLLDAWKTSGGHRRISRQSIERILLNPSGLQSAAMGPTEAIAGGALASPPPRRLSILVVEDDEDLRELYALNLARWPMHPIVITAENGYEALIQMGSVKPDILITDLTMPGMDGFRMLETIRGVKALAHMVVVVVTGISASEISNHGSLMPDIRVLPKPVPFTVLKDIAEQSANNMGLRTTAG